MDWLTGNWYALLGPVPAHVALAIAAIVASFIIGYERFRKENPVGFRTLGLVSVGSCIFVMAGIAVSPYGSSEAGRVIAQIISGIGFLGAGLIFTRKDAVRGLTSAATVWVTAAVGMASGSGLVSLAIGMTVVFLFTMFVLGPIAAILPTRDTKRVLRITYKDGAGILREVLGTATAEGYSTFIFATRRLEGGDLVQLDARFKGTGRLSSLIPVLGHIQGVQAVEVKKGDDIFEEEESSDD